jgi:hypothetical protein
MNAIRLRLGKKTKKKKAYPHHLVNIKLGVVAIALSGKIKKNAITLK